MPRNNGSVVYDIFTGNSFNFTSQWMLVVSKYIHVHTQCHTHTYASVCMLLDNLRK